MTREEEIKKQLFEISTSNFNNSVVDSSAYFAGFTDGAQWADEHPVSCNNKTALYFNDIIYKNGYEEAVDKACKWLKEQSCCGYIEDTDVNEFVEQFCKAMKGE